jgi:hypothetical protein
MALVLFPGAVICSLSLLVVSIQCSTNSASFCNGEVYCLSLPAAVSGKSAKYTFACVLYKLQKKNAKKIAAGSKNTLPGFILPQNTD